MRFRGRLSIYKTDRHGYIARKWQKPGRPNPSARELIGRELFKSATQMVKVADPAVIAEAKIAAGPTAWTWKDYLISNMYGRHSIIYWADGTSTQGWRQMSDQAQELLDSITQENGALLVRTPTGWQGLTPGATATVLTSAGPMSLPDYIAASGGGGGGSKPDLFAPPLAADFGTIVNGGGASPAPSCSDDTNAGCILDSGPVTASSENIRAALQAVPGGGTWTVTARLRLTAYPAGNRKGGLYLSDGTKFIAIERSMTASDAYRVSKYTNSTTFSTSTTFTLPAWWEYYRMHFDGTKLYFSMSGDGVDFTQLFNENSGTFLTATLVGLGMDCATGGSASNKTSEHMWLACSYWATGA